MSLPASNSTNSPSSTHTTSYGNSNGNGNHKQLSSLAENFRVLRDTGSPRSPTVALSSRHDQRSTGVHRKHTPSPLHSSQTSTPDLQSALRTTTKPYSPPSSQSSPSPSNQDHARSPRERLQAFLGSQAQGQSSPDRPKPGPWESGGGGEGQQLAEQSSYVQPRNVSAPTLTSAGLSPPTSPKAMASSKPSGPAPRPVAVRTSSIDSAASSISSASQSYRTNSSLPYRSQPLDSASSPPDPGSLLAAAGSVEAALLNLWKEKQSASAHNTKLWRLVEKQRAMILGLNKDLERALKDKERYRKKLKEHLAHVPPLPGAAQRLDAALDRDRSQSPTLSEQTQEPRSRNNSAQSVSLESAREPGTGTSPGQPCPATYQQSPSSVPVPGPLVISHAQKESAAAVTTAEVPSASKNRDGARFVDDDDRGQALHGIAGDADRASSSEPIAPEEYGVLAEADSPVVVTARPDAPTFALIGPTPIMGSAEFGSPDTERGGRAQQPVRKPPPKPLDLSKPSRIGAGLPAPASDDGLSSGSDDILEVHEITINDRGRRRTREDDDRLREALAMREQDQASRSKKGKKGSSKSKSKSKSKGNAQDNQPEADPTAKIDDATGPREPTAQRSSGSPDSPDSPILPPAAASGAAEGFLGPRGEFSKPQTSLSSHGALLSPGLPVSPRPGDRPPHAPQPRLSRPTTVELPSSPRNHVGPTPLSPRAPKQPLPLPPNSPLAIASPHLTRAEAYQQQSISQAVAAAAAASVTPQVPSLLKPPQHSQSSQDVSQERIYHGFISDQYPNLLLPPNALPLIDVKVFSSRLRPSRNSILMPKPAEEDPVFILAIYARSDGRQLWRVEKTIVALPLLDQQVRALSAFNGKLPERALFSGHAPAKIDARRAALNSYFNTLLDTPMDEKAGVAVCEFFSSDVVGVEADDVQPATEGSQGAPSHPASKNKMRKEGYLTKRGKNFGGWKARYFVLEGPELRYYETAGGPHLGTIKLQNAQIGKQSQQQSNPSPSRRSEDADNQYRHAFLILEPKRKDSSSLVRHVLCAESDEERDAWVDALLQHVDSRDEDGNGNGNVVGAGGGSSSNAQPKTSDKEPGSSRSGVLTKSAPEERSQRARGRETPESEKQESLQGVNYEDTVAAEAPVRGPRGPRNDGGSSPPANAPPSSGQAGPSLQHPAISGPTNGAVIQNAEMWGNRSLMVTNVKEKKRSIFGFRGRVSADPHLGQQGPGPTLTVGQQSTERNSHGRAVFGAPLMEAVEFAPPEGADAFLPAVVYRCLEYLRSKNAATEEGIFRLSGSNLVIKALRERFNAEGDVKLLDGQYYDVHAVASLLKLYLRELPVSILTRELHLDFLKVLDLDDRQKKLEAFNVLVHKLPRVNLELLRALSLFLIDIVNNSDVNKMTVRNVGIVFAPTLNIPAPLISLFLTDFTEVFGKAVDEASSPVIKEITVTAPLTPESIRSPRRQMFSDLPTPAYSQTSFQSSMVLPIQHPPSAADAKDTGTGFIPMHPSYETQLIQNPQADHQQRQGVESGYGSINGALSVPMDSKAKRRESGMLLVSMGLGGQRKLANALAKGEGDLVKGDSAFD